MSKRPPELTWQDKAILIVIPVVVLVIFVLANHMTQDNTVSVAFTEKLPKTEVRDSGTIEEVLPSEVASGTQIQKCRVRTRDGQVVFTLEYRVVGSETMNLQVGRLIQVFGEYQYDLTGGKLLFPYKGKSGQPLGWAVYENRRYHATESPSKDQL
ncbi:MAG TPA: DUF3465 domain-containing protein [Candidatus Ozemobacteraceae bacterium]|nr:DUF3465 domain-containing protein [Candidatus Ozemobacteraceae bacterium]